MGIQKFLFFHTALAAGVVELTDDNFDAKIAEKDFTLVKFFAPWCGHCKSMAEDYKTAAGELAAKDTVALAELDATIHKNVAKKFGVSGYPTLKWISKDGDASEYTGGRKKDDFVKWVSDMLLPAVQVVEEVPESDHAAVTLTCKESHEFYEKVASVNRQKFKFFHIQSGDDCAISMKHDGEDATVTKDLSETAFKTFLDNNRFPKFGELNGDSFGDYSQEGKGMVWVLGKMSDSKELSDFVAKQRADILAIADNHSDYNFAYTDTVQFKDALEGMLSVTSFPALVVQPKIGGKKKFVKQGEDSADFIFSSADIEKFIADIKSGAEKAMLKSAEPGEPYDGDVCVLVGKNLKEGAYTPDTDVMLEVYAPWCGHCKKLEPEYNKAATALRKDFPNIKLCKLDGTENDSPVDDIDWSGFPTIKVIKAGSSKAESYNGGRDAKGIVEYFMKNHSDEATRAKLSLDILEDKKDDADDKEEL